MRDRFECLVLYFVYIYWKGRNAETGLCNIYVEWDLSTFRLLICQNYSVCMIQMSKWENTVRKSEYNVTPSVIIL